MKGLDVSLDVERYQLHDAALEDHGHGLPGSVARRSSTSDASFSPSFGTGGS
jgi:hypothetical protein